MGARVLGTLVLVLLAGACGAPGDRAVTVFGGRYAKERLLNLLSFEEPRFQDAGMAGVAVSRVLKRHGTLARWEVEGQLAHHFGEEDHWELVGVGIFRWTRFPWSHPTSLALGEGLSFASETPDLEDRFADDGSTEILNYLLVETTVGVPGTRRWSLVFRLHHRSGVFGLFDGIEEGSNHLLWGLRWEL